MSLLGEKERAKSFPLFDHNEAFLLEWLPRCSNDSVKRQFEANPTHHPTKLKSQSFKVDSVVRFLQLRCWKGFMSRGVHYTEVVFALLTQRPRV